MLYSTCTVYCLSGKVILYISISPFFLFLISIVSKYNTQCKLKSEVHKCTVDHRNKWKHNIIETCKWLGKLKYINTL